MTTPLQDPTDPSKWLIGRVAEPFFGAVESDGLVVNVHPRERCEGRPCVMHDPSDHHMRQWPLTWRDDKGVMERQCPHNQGHPDPDDAAFLISSNREYLTEHHCDGCCRVGSDPLR